MADEKPLTRQAVLNRIAEDVAAKNATANAEAFMEAHEGDFWRVPENIETITDWLLANSLQPTVANFETSFQYCSRAGLLLEPSDADKARQAETSKVWTAKEIDDMPSAEYKRLLATDENFKRQVDAQETPTYRFGEIVRTQRMHTVGERV